MQDPLFSIEQLITTSIRHIRCGEYHEGYLCIKDAVIQGEKTSVDDSTICRILIQAARCAYYISRFDESETYLDEFDALFGECSSGSINPLRFESTLVRANVLRRRGDFYGSLNLLERLNGQTESEIPHSLTVERLLVEGACLFYTNEIENAELKLETALGLATHYSDSRSRAKVLIMMGLLAQTRGFLKKAEDYLSRARDLCKADKDRYGQAAAGLNIGIVLYRRGRFGESEKAISKARDFFMSVGWKLGICRCLLAMGNVKKYRRDFSKALRLYRRAEKIAYRNGYAREKALVHEFVGEVLYERGDYAASRICYERSLEVASGISPDGDIVVEVNRRLGELHLAVEDYKKAAHCLEKGLSLSRRLSDRMEEGVILRALGKINFAYGKCDRGIRNYTRAIELLRSAGCRFELAKTHLIYAEELLAGSAGKKDDGSSETERRKCCSVDSWSSLVEAGFIFDESGSDYYKAKVDALISKVISESRRLEPVTGTSCRGEDVLSVKYSRDYLIQGQFAGVSEHMMEVWRQVRMASSFTGSVLITGETGTGKELIAALIHEASDRANRPFVAVNCAAVPDHLFESEFFGHRKGCFTGAAIDRRGIFEEAHGGTLLLDEVGELSTLQQVKLLRVLQEGKIRRVGENIERPIDIKIVSATNQDLEKKLMDSTLREDFFYRINAERIHIPPLRDRPEDIIPLMTFYLCNNGGGEGDPVRIEGAALKCLQRYAWPGNIRELFSVLERVRHISGGGVIRKIMLPERIRNGFGNPASSKSVSWGNDNVDHLRAKLQKALNFCSGNKTAAAKWLGISRGTLYKELKRTGLDNLIV